MGKLDVRERGKSGGLSVIVLTLEEWDREELWSYFSRIYVGDISWSVLQAIIGGQTGSGSLSILRNAHTALFWDLRTTNGCYTHVGIASCDSLQLYVAELARLERLTTGWESTECESGQNARDWMRRVLHMCLWSVHPVVQAFQYLIWHPYTDTKTNAGSVGAVRDKIHHHSLWGYKRHGCTFHRILRQIIDNRLKDDDSGLLAVMINSKRAKTSCMVEVNTG